MKLATWWVSPKSRSLSLEVEAGAGENALEIGFADASLNFDMPCLEPIFSRISF